MNIDKLIKNQNKGINFNKFNFNKITNKYSKISNTTKTGTGMAGASVKMQNMWKQASIPQRNLWRKKYKDSDGDRVPDRFDCQPLNPMRQDSIQTLWHAGDKPPSETLKQEGKVFGFSTPQYAQGWAQKHNKSNIYQFTSVNPNIDEKTYNRPIVNGMKYNDNEYIATNVAIEQEVDEEELQKQKALMLVKKLNQHAFQPIKNINFAAKLMSERIKLDNPLFNNLSNDRSSGKLFKPIERLDPTYGVFFVDINFLRNRRGNSIMQQSGGYKSVDDIKQFILNGGILDDIPGYELRDGVVGEGNHRIEALYQLGYKSAPVQIWGGW
ncbi:MAG: hypothetical protein ACOCVF_02845 [bacterium]